MKTHPPLNDDYLSTYVLILYSPTFLLSYSISLVIRPKLHDVQQKNLPSPVSHFFSDDLGETASLRRSHQYCAEPQQYHLFYLHTRQHLVADHEMEGELSLWVHQNILTLLKLLPIHGSGLYHLFQKHGLVHDDPENQMSLHSDAAQKFFCTMYSELTTLQ